LVIKKKGIKAGCTQRRPKINNCRPKSETWLYMPWHLWRSLDYWKCWKRFPVSGGRGEKAICCFFFMLQPCI